MPFTNLNLIMVTGKFFLLNNNPASGSVTFTPSVVLTDTVANEIIYPSNFTVNLNAQGAFSIQLPATNDPDISPTGWTYEVKENIVGSLNARTYNIELPYDQAGGTVDLADIVPAVDVELVTSYALAANVLHKSANLSDVDNASTALANLGGAADSAVVKKTGDHTMAGGLRINGHVIFKSGRPWYDPAGFAATDAQYAVVGNGQSKPLSGFYASLAAAQADYPLASALTDELDAILLLTAHGALPATGGEIRPTAPHYVLNRSLVVTKDSVTIATETRYRRATPAAATTWTMNGTVPLIDLTGGQGHKIKGIRLVMPAVAAAAIRAVNVSQGRIESCRVDGTSRNGTGILIDDGYGWDLVDVHVEAFNFGIDWPRNNHACTLDACAIFGCNQNVRIGATSASAGIRISNGTKIENALVVGLNIIRGLSTTVDGDYFEDVTPGARSIILGSGVAPGPVGTVITCNYFNGNGVVSHAMEIDRVRTAHIYDNAAVNYVNRLIQNNGGAGVTGIALGGNDIDTIPLLTNSYSGVVYRRQGGYVALSDNLEFNTAGTNVIGLRTNGTRARLVFNNDGTVSNVAI